MTSRIKISFFRAYRTSIILDKAISFLIKTNEQLERKSIQRITYICHIFILIENVGTSLIKWTGKMIYRTGNVIYRTVHTVHVLSYGQSCVNWGVVYDYLKIEASRRGQNTFVHKKKNALSQKILT